MIGNVWEWCYDWDGDFKNKDENNPQGAKKGLYRVSRGGSWSGSVRSCRIDNRRSNGAYADYNNLGFRFASNL